VGPKRQRPMDCGAESSVAAWSVVLEFSCGLGFDGWGPALNRAALPGRWMGLCTILRGVSSRVYKINKTSPSFVIFDKKWFGSVLKVDRVLIKIISNYCSKTVFRRFFSLSIIFFLNPWF
jgi:hypothetical protein